MEHRVSSEKSKNIHVLVRKTRFFRKWKFVKFNIESIGQRWRPGLFLENAKNEFFATLYFYSTTIQRKYCTFYFITFIEEL